MFRQSYHALHTFRSGGVRSHVLRHVRGHASKPSLYRWLKGSGPPVLAQWPYAYHVFRYSTISIGILLAHHIFLEYFFESHFAWGISMMPTIEAEGELLLISKYYHHGRGIGVGDIISFKSPIKVHEHAVKRVIGMPGDFVLRDTPGVGAGIMLQVPEGHCWVVGDNVKWSRDSRIWGPLPLALVRGKVIAKAHPNRSMSPLRLQWIDHGIKPEGHDWGDDVD